MRTRPLTLTALAALALTGCGGGASPSAAPSTPPVVSAEACRAYDAAIKQLAHDLDGQHAHGFLVASNGAYAAREVRLAAALTDGPARQAFEDTASRIQLIAEQGNAAPADVVTGDQAVRDAISSVDRMCRAAGAGLDNVPAPAG